MKVFRKLFAAALTLTLLINSAAAYSSTYIDTAFDYVLCYIENYSLFTQKTEMSETERAKKNAYLEEHPEDLEKVVNEYLKTLDTHSMFLSADEYSSSYSTITGYVGVGIGLQQTQEGIKVSDVFRSGPAYEAGVKVGDIVVRVDGVSVNTLDVAGTVSRLRGEEGTTVRMVLQRDGKEIELTVSRRRVNQDYVYSKTAAEGVEYISIGAFGSMDDYYAFKDIWEGLDEKRTRAVILDLRGNGGGVLDAANAVADLMLEKKGVYMNAIRWREDMGGTEKQYSSGGGLPLNKVCVLVDENTASAAELLAGTLKEAGGATVIGNTTYGKGQGQYHLTLGKYKLVITTLEMQIPQTGCWEGKGIAPTIEMKSLTSMSDYFGKAGANNTKTLLYGEQSEQVRLMTRQLTALGYYIGNTTRFDSKVLAALRAYQADQGLQQTFCADTATLASLQENFKTDDPDHTYVDEAYGHALALCREAAGKPARYKTMTDGNWRAA